MSNLIRKISIGKDYKVDAMHYSVGQEVYGGHTIKHIVEEEDKYSIFIEKKGDLLNSMYFVAKLPKISRDYLNDTNNTNHVRWVDYIGNVLIENVKLYIGGARRI